MHFDRRDSIVTWATAGALLVGIALVVFFDTVLSVVGIVLIIVSAVMFLFDVGTVIGKWGDVRNTGGQ